MSRAFGRRGIGRRSYGVGSGPATFSPPNASTPLAWWLAGDDVTLNGADVSSWNDKSGNARHWPQATASIQPRFVASAINSQPGVDFDAVNLEFLNGPDLDALGLTSAESFIVLRVNADPPANNAIAGLWQTGSSTNADFYPLAGTGIIYDSFGSNVRKLTVNPTPSLASPRIYSCHGTAGEWTNYLDGTQLFTTATNTMGWSTTPKLGKSFLANYLDGVVCEWIVYTGKLSASDRASVDGYLKTKYAI